MSRIYNFNLEVVTPLTKVICLIRGHDWARFIRMVDHGEERWCKRCDRREKKIYKSWWGGK